MKLGLKKKNSIKVINKSNKVSKYNYTTIQKLGLVYIIRVYIFNTKKTLYNKKKRNITIRFHLLMY